MNWLTALPFAILLLSIQYDVVHGALPNLSKSPWTDPAKARLFMDCMLTKISESEILPDQDKEDMESMMDTLMSAVNDANARGQSSGAQLQAIDMAIASSLAELVVAEDASNQTSIVMKTQDLSEALEKCFESVMGAVNRNFISETKDLISMFSKQAAEDIEEEQDEDEEDSSLTQTTTDDILEDSSKEPGGDNFAPQTTPVDAGDQFSETASNDDQPQIFQPDFGSQMPQTANRYITGETNNMGDIYRQRAGLRNGGYQQTFPTAMNPNRYSSSFQSSESSANTYQSSQTLQDSSNAVGRYGGPYSRPQFFEPKPIGVGPQISPPAPFDVGPQFPQAAPDYMSRVGNELGDTSTQRGVLRNGVPQQIIPPAVYPNRLSSSPFQTASQSADNTYQSSQTFQDSSQIPGGYRGLYSGPQFFEPKPSDVVPQNSQPAPIDAGPQISQPAPINVEPQVPQEAPELSSGAPNEFGDTSRRRKVVRNRFPQQTSPTLVYPNRLSSSTTQTSQSAANSYQSSQTFQRSSQTPDRYGRTYTEPQFSEPAPIEFGPDVSNPPPDTDIPQVSKPSPVSEEPQVSQATPGRSSKGANDLEDASTRRAVHRSGRRHHVPKSRYPKRLTSSSLEKTNQSSESTYQSSKTSQVSSPKDGEYDRTYAGSQYSKPAPPIGLEPQVSQPAPTEVQPEVPQATPRYISRGAKKGADTSTRRTVLRNGVRRHKVPKAMYPNRSSSAYQTSQSADNSYQSSQTYPSSSKSSDGYGETYRGPQFSEPTPISYEPQVSKPPPIAPGPQVSQAATRRTSKAAKKLEDTSRRTISRSGAPQQTVSTAAYPNRSSSSSFQTTSQSDANSYQSSKTFQRSSQKGGRYGGTYSRPQFSAPTPYDAEPPQAAPEPISKSEDELSDTSTRRANQRNRVPQKAVSTAAYPNRSSSSSFQSSQKSASSSYQSSQTFQDSSPTADSYDGTYPGPQFYGPTPIPAEPQIPQETPDLISKVANALANSPTMRKNLRSCVSEQIASNMIQGSIESLANTLGYDPNNLFGIALPAFYQLTPGSDTPDYSQALSTFLVTSGILNEENVDNLGAPVLSAVVNGISNAAEDMGFNEDTCDLQNDVSSSTGSQTTSASSSSFSQSASSFESDTVSTDDGYTDDAELPSGPCPLSPEISVLPTINSPNGLRSVPAGARISQIASSLLNSISPSGVDAYSLAYNIQAIVSNLISSGMSPNDAKVEALLELIVSLLQIVSNALIRGVDPIMAPSVTSSAARSFELALA